MRTVLALILAASAVAAGKPPEDRRNFQACPIMRDTPPVPCWLAEYAGELYYLGPQGDISEPFHPPQLKHQAMIEGTVSDEPRICGGIVLKKVVASVIPEVDPACNTILPAEGHRMDRAPRGPGPANRGVQAATDPLKPRPPRPSPTYTGTHTFTVLFGFDGDYINVHQFQGVLQAANYAKANGGKVRVTGHRGSVLLSSGRLAEEKPLLAQQRTAKVVEALSELGVTAQAEAVAALEPVTGVDDHLRRRVEITVTPAG